MCVDHRDVFRQHLGRQARHHVGQFVHPPHRFRPIRIGRDGGDRRGFQHAVHVLVLGELLLGILAHQQELVLSDTNHIPGLEGHGLRDALLIHTRAVA